MNQEYERRMDQSARGPAVRSSDLVLPQPTEDSIAAFHAHLDACSQCRNHPFALCAEGARRLEKAALG